MSTAQSVTAVFSQVFTDGTGQGSDIPVESVVIKAVHITELRSAIDTLRAVNHLAPVEWTDATLSPETTTVESFYISDLRAALRPRIGPSTSRRRNSLIPTSSPA